MIALFAALALGAPRLDRIDVLSDDPGRWLADDLPRATVAPEVTALRFAGQITPVWNLGRGWQLGTSLSSQALRREWLVEGPWWATAGLSTHYALPRGALAGIAWRAGAARVGISAAATTTATWDHLNWRSLSVVPSLSVGWVHPARAPWMRNPP